MRLKIPCASILELCPDRNELLFGLIIVSMETVKNTLAHCLGMRGSIILTRTESTVLSILFLVRNEGNLVNSASSSDGHACNFLLVVEVKVNRIAALVTCDVACGAVAPGKLDVFDQLSVGPITAFGIASGISPYLDLSDGVLLFGEREFGTAGTSRAFGSDSSLEGGCAQFRWGIQIEGGSCFRHL